MGDDPNGDLRMGGDDDARDDVDSPLHAANALPGASDLAAAQAALAAATAGLNPYQVAALSVPSSPRADPPPPCSAASKVKTSGRGSAGHDHKGGVKKPPGKHVSPEKRAKLTGATTQPLLHPVTPLHSVGLAEPPEQGLDLKDPGNPNSSILTRVLHLGFRI